MPNAGASTINETFNASAGWMPDFVQRGFYKRLQAMSAVELSARLQAGQNVQSPEIQSVIKDISAYEKKITAAGLSKTTTAEMAEIMNARGFGRAAVAMLKNPGAVGQIMAEGLVYEAPTIGAAGASLLTGPAAPVVMAASTTALTATASYGSKYLEVMRDDRFDLTQPQEITEYLSIKNFRERAESKALLAGGVGAGVNIATLGIGGVLGRTAAAAKASGTTFNQALKDPLGQSAVSGVVTGTIGQTIEANIVDGRNVTPGEYLIGGVTSLAGGATAAAMAKAQLNPSYMRHLAQGYKDRGVYDMSALHYDRTLYKQMTLDNLSEPGSGSGVAHYAEKPNKNGKTDYALQMKEPKIVGALEPKGAAQFTGDIKRAMDDLPPAVKTLFAERSVEFKLGRRVRDVTPEIADLKPRGWSEGRTMDHTSGFYRSDRYEIVMTQETKSVRDSHAYTSTYTKHDRYHVALHESGHALDNIINGTDLSTGVEAPHTKALREAYERDVAGLNGKNTHNDHHLGYFLSKDKGGSQEDAQAGRSEIFAELFAERVGGQSMGMHRAFPETAKAMGKLMESLDYEMKQQPPDTVITATTLEQHREARYNDVNPQMRR